MAVKTISGSDLILSIDDTSTPSLTDVEVIGGSTSCTFNVNQETIDITNKDSQGHKAFISGVNSWTIDCDAFYTDGSVGTETVRPSTIFTAMKNGYKIAVKFHTATGQTAVQKWTGYGFITSLSVSGSVAEWSTYSISIQGSGALTMANA
jgi:TP901-1 family phage major tail protein